MVVDVVFVNMKIVVNIFKVFDVKEYEYMVVCYKNVFFFVVYECCNLDSSKNNGGEENVKIYVVVMVFYEDGCFFN